MVDYHAYYFMAGFFLFLVLSIIFVLPLAILQILKVVKPGTQLGPIATILISISTSIACICFAITIAMISVFSYIPYYAAALLITVFLILLFAAFKPWRPEWFRKKSNMYLCVVLVFMFIIFWVICALTRDVCVTSSPQSVSVYQTRKLNGDPCAKTAPKPCHVYITFGTNASTSAIVHFHTSRKFASPTVYWGDDATTPNVLSATTSTKMDLEVTRYVYYAELDNLTPDSVVWFSAGDASDPTSFSATKKFKTAPLGSNFHFVAGGDMGVSSRTSSLVKSAASSEPLYMALGGDLAYANAMRSCYPRWDAFLSLYEENAITPSGFTVPIVAAVGNHEAGGFDQPLSHLRFYSRYFVQELFNGRKPEDLPSYHVQYIGNQVLVSLDSNVVTPPAKQSNWLSSILSSAPIGSFKTALYHAPGYPSVRAYSDSESKLVRQHFVPVFDQHNLALAFENHDHAYKRTHRMRDSTANPTGTLYVGDGAFGVKSRVPPTPQSIPSDKSYLAQYQGRSFYLVVNVTSTDYQVNAIDTDKTIFDSFGYGY